jgi:hypothetical protein
MPFLGIHSALIGHGFFGDFQEISPAALGMAISLPDAQASQQNSAIALAFPSISGVNIQ